MKERVVVAMSGGVDSSVAAALLKEQGYEVIGITMCFNLPDTASKKPRCCGLKGIEDARRVAHKLGIRHYVLNMQKALEKEVIKDFCQEYLKGRTPNPCVRCNQYIKFGALLEKALSLGAAYLATGHYARVTNFRDSPLRSRRKSYVGDSPSTLNAKRYTLKKARDKKKDQSYFLYRLNQHQLKHVLFPLGNYIKKQVRDLAKKFSLPVADKAESQEICFLPSADYRRFLKAKSGLKIKPGLVVDEAGKVLGRHKGIAFYTIGQRQGLGIARGYPVYITGIDAKSNRITIGSKEDACRSQFLTEKPHFILKPAKNRIAASVRIRYNHKEAPAQILLRGRKIKIKFKTPQFAITPGQSAVIYKRDQVLGGGLIKEVLD